MHVVCITKFFRKDLRDSKITTVPMEDIRTIEISATLHECSIVSELPLRLGCQQTNKWVLQWITSKLYQDSAAAGPV